MPRHLKRGVDASAIKAADAKVREMVEQILADVDAHKDAAVRELSQKFEIGRRPRSSLRRRRSSARSGKCASAISTTLGSRRRRCAISHGSRGRRCGTSK